MSVEKDYWSEYEKNVKKKKALLVQALTIAQAQEEMIRLDNIEELKNSMEERERLINEIDRIDFKCAQIKRNIRIAEKEISWHLGEVEKGIMELLLHIQSIDQVNGEQLRCKLKEYQNQIRKLRQTKVGLHSYTQPYTREDGVFFDVKK